MLLFLTIVFLLYVSASLLLNVIAGLQEAVARRQNARAPLPPRKGDELPFNWRDPDAVARVFFPAFRARVGDDFAFFRAMVGPLAGRPGLVREFYLALTRVHRSRLALLMETLWFWYGRRSRRSLGDWPPAGRRFAGLNDYFDELVAFLFAEHPPPPVAARAWWEWDQPAWQAFIEQTTREDRAHPGKGPGNVALELFFYLSAGGNPAKAPFLNWDLSRGAARHFLETPAGWSPHAAFWRATLLADGGRRVVDEWGKGLPAPEGFRDAAFWRDFYRLLLREKTLPPYGDVQRAIDRIAWLHSGAGPAEWAGKYGSLRRAEPAFSFKGRTWRSLLRYLNERFRLPFRPPAGMAHRYERIAADGARYAIVFLDSAEALLEEGAAMGHCLGHDEHVEAAMAGAHSYWSLRRLTAAGEVRPAATFTLHQGKIAEWNGFFHEEYPEAAEETLVERWLEEAVWPVEAGEWGS